MAGNSTAILTLGPSSTFNGPVTTTSPVLIFNSSTFNSTGDFAQTSNTNTGNSRGGNVFVGTSTFTNSGDADLVFGSNAADPGDTFQGSATFNDLGGGRIRVSENSAGTVFNGNATFNSSGANNAANRIQISRFNGATTTFNGTTTINNNGNSSDIHVCYDVGTLVTFNGPLILNSATTAAGDFELGRDGNVLINGSLQLNSTCADNIEMSAGNGTVTFGNGGITIGGSGFAQGQLTFRNFTQTGTTAITLALTGTGRMNVGPSSAFGGNVTFTSPRLFLSGTTFNGTAYFEKTEAVTTIAMATTHSTAQPQ
ncbi:MAG: hypothetical protein HC859_11265 [Bacteroidia bacterium]|nr:hypothetical protein [Bacteroidia bacterium]